MERAEAGNPVFAPDALVGAESVVERIAADEAAAREERTRLEHEDLLPLEPEPAVTAALRPDEHVVDVRPATRVERIGAGEAPDLFGRLHLTTQRLVLTGSEPLEVELSQVQELGLVGERLLVGLPDGHALCFDIAAPRVFRVRASHLIAQAR